MRERRKRGCEVGEVWGSEVGERRGGEVGEGEQCERGRKGRGGEKGVRKKVRQKDVCEERRGEGKRQAQWCAR